MNRKQILVEMFMRQSKERLAELAADLMLTNEMEPATEPVTEFPNNGKRITQDEIDTVLRVAGGLGRFHQSELEELAQTLGRKPESIAAILRTNFVPPTVDEDEDKEEPQRATPNPQAAARGL